MSYVISFERYTYVQNDPRTESSNNSLRFKDTKKYREHTIRIILRHKNIYI